MAISPDKPGSRQKKLLLVCFLLAALTFGTFSSVSTCGFVSYDDPDYVQENEMVHRGLTWEGVKWAFTAGHAANWHPLTWLTHMVDCQLYGLQPAGHHISSLLVHVANTLLVFLLLHRLTGAVWRAAFVAVLFGVHPLHVESVAWLSERKDVLSTFFGLLALLCYSRYARPKESPGSRRSRLDYGLALFFFACGLMSKPMLVTLPFVFLLLDYWPNQRLDLRVRSTWWRLLGEKLPFFALAAISSYITIQVQAGRTVQSLSNFGIIDRLSNVLVSYVLYLGKMIWPAKLAFFYPLVSAPPIWQALAAATFLGAVTVTAILIAKRHPYAITGWLWYLGTLVPVIGIVHVGEQALADRYTYVPLIGIFLGITWTVPQILAGRIKIPTTAWSLVAAAIIAACIPLTVRQIGFWKNSRVMLERALAVTRDNFLAHNNYGVILADEGRFDEALAHYREAIRVKPMYARAFNNMGTALSLNGQYEEAIENYIESIKLRPNEAQTHHNLAVTYARIRRFDLTVEHCREALRLNPNYSTAFSDLALALSLTNQLDEAKVYFLKALEVEPDNAQTHLQLARIYLREQQIAPAAKHYRAAFELDPQHLNAAATLTWLLATSNDASIRNGNEALAVVDRAGAAIRQHPLLLRSVAAAYAELGRFAEAVAAAESALRNASEPSLQQSLELDLQVYRAGKPNRIQ